MKKIDHDVENAKRLIDAYQVALRDKVIPEAADLTFPEVEYLLGVDDPYHRAGYAYMLGWMQAARLILNSSPVEAFSLVEFFGTLDDSCVTDADIEEWKTAAVEADRD